MPDMQLMTEVKTRNIRITQELVQEKLEKLNVNKSCGPDDIHPFILQRAATELWKTYKQYCVKDKQCTENDKDIICLLKQENVLESIHSSYKTSTRGVQVWSPHLRKYIDLIEGVQRRATRLVPELKSLTYEERLEQFELTKIYCRVPRSNNTNPEAVDEHKVLQNDLNELQNGLKNERCPSMLTNVSSCIQVTIIQDMNTA